MMLDIVNFMVIVTMSEDIVRYSEFYGNRDDVRGYSEI